jgi:hypothetical protein
MKAVVSGILYLYTLDKTNAQKSDITTKVDVYNMQHTAISLLKTSWAPLNSWNFIQ